MCLFVLLINNTILILISFILFHSTYKNQIKEVFSFILNSTANTKALRGSLGALSVNKLSHIPKLQPISAVYENQ